MDLQMGLAETMKNIAKGIQTEINNAPFNGVGYVTEKLYMLLQLYIQNKGWNPSVELLQCFTELKEASMLPSASYLQMLASRVTLDSQGRLILRENGKIILPYEHFANAVMLKHMNGPHGLHLNVEATVRAVMDSYTIGRDEFGMEKEFIVEVVQNCPNPTCRYYKTQLPAGPSASSSHSKPNSYASESHSGKASTNSSGASNNANSTSTSSALNKSATPTNNINAPSETPSSLPQSSNAGGSNNSPSTGSSTSLLSLPIDLTNVFEANLRSVMAASGAADLAKLSAVVKGGGGRSGLSITRTSSNDILQQAIRNEANNRRQIENETRRQLEAETRRLESETRRLESETRRNSNNSSTGGNSGGNETDEMNSVTSHKLSDFLKANIESLDSLNKDLYAAHNGTWGGSITPPERGDSPKSRPNSTSSGGGRIEQDALGQEKIVRAFSEIMRNMGRMKACVRPSMCKPYGKQSETLQKTLVDTIQLVQSLRSFLPPPHIAVSSWKNEDKGGGGNGNTSINLANIQVSAASLAAAAAVANRKPPGSLGLGNAGMGLNSGQLGLSTGGISGQMSLNTAAQIVSGSNLEELVEAVRQQQKAMATGD